MGRVVVVVGVWGVGGGWGWVGKVGGGGVAMVGGYGDGGEGVMDGEALRWLVVRRGA
mgnify:CR=1 FL=1